MLAAPSSSPQYNPFLPIHSSPLARDARRATFSFAMNPSNASNHANSNTNTRQQRQNPKTVPKLSTERLSTNRRGAFLRKVKEGRDEKKWETRSEDIMRADFLSRQRAWEAAQARNAPPSSDTIFNDEEEESDLPNGTPMDISSQAPPLPEEEVEEFLREEDQELEALLEFMPQEEDDEGMRDDGESLWSEGDVDYEALFEQVLSQGQQRGQQEAQNGGDGGEEMDMS